jgi:hypothetical protein
MIVSMEAQRSGQSWFLNFKNRQVFWRTLYI